MRLIRDALIGDAGLLLEMLRESAAEQGFPDEVAVSERDLRSDGFSENPRFRAMIAELDGAPAGMALFFFNYSTWGSRLGLYLEDLYVRPAYRRSGVGRALLERLAHVAQEEGCGRFQWVVHRANTAAIALYESFGATALRDWMLMSLKGAALEAIAERPEQ